MNLDFSLDHLEPDEVFPDPVVHQFSAPVRRLKSCLSRVDLLASDEGREIEQWIWEEIERNDIKILSYDVFDTLLLRNNKPEALRYHELSKQILDKLRRANQGCDRLKALTAVDLVETRAIGMKTSYRTRPLVQGCGEGLIEEVLSAQCFLLGLDAKFEQLFHNAEIEYEADNLSLNPVLAKIAARFKDTGGKVVLISDMYLRAEAIEKIIEKLVDEPIHDQLFSSADLVISKRSGKIFPVIEKELGADGGNFLHIGDAWIGDVQRPRKAGWKTLYFPVSEPEILERKRGLARFVSLMDEKGIETRTWAKI